MPRLLTSLGAVTVEHPFVIALLSARVVQRLHHVEMSGIASRIGLVPRRSRWDHSVGTMMLVKRLGGDVIEQAAALLHDVSHTAFSHVLDFGLGARFATRQSYHDDHRERYLAASDVPEICARFGVDWQLFLESHSFPRLEQPSPRLCADRVEYALADSLLFGILTVHDAQQILSNIRFYEGRVVMRDAALARKFADAFISCDARSWCSANNVGLSFIAARAMLRAHAVGDLPNAEFWETDEFVWRRLLSSRDQTVCRLTQLLRADTYFERTQEHGDIDILPKVRTVDPDVTTGCGMRRLSELDSDFAANVCAYRRSAGGNWNLRITTDDSYRRTLWNTVTY